MSGDTHRLSLSRAEHFDFVLAVRAGVLGLDVDVREMLVRHYGIDLHYNELDEPDWGDTLLGADLDNLIALGGYLGVTPASDDDEIPAALEIDPYSELVAAETALRETVRTAIGESWIDDFADDKRKALEDKRTEEEKRRDGVAVSRELLDYTEAYHLQTLISKNWEKVRPILLDKKRAEVNIGVMLDVRNAIAHARPVAPFERQLLAGVAGQIQNLLAIHRSNSSGPEAFYASINYVRDSFGEELSSGAEQQTVVPRFGIGQVVSFECSASDPYDRNVEWIFRTAGPHESDVEGLEKTRILGKATGATANFEWIVGKEDVGEGRVVKIFMRTEGDYHRNGTWDDSVIFQYHVNPPIPPRRR